MSRKARAQDRSSWKTANLVYAFTGDYGPFKPRGNDPIGRDDGVLIYLWLHNDDADNEKAADSCNDSSCGDCHRHHDHRHEHHVSKALRSLAADAQQLLLIRKQQQQQLQQYSTILAVDLYTLLTTTTEEEDNGNHHSNGTKKISIHDMLEAETKQDDLTKGFGKTILRWLQRLRVEGVGLAATGLACPLALKLCKALNASCLRGDPLAIADLYFLHPTLSASFVNQQLLVNSHKYNHIHNKKSKSKPQQFTNLHVVFENQSAQDKRLAMIRHAYPQGKTKVVAQTSSGAPSLLLETLLDENVNDEIPPYDPDYCCEMTGKSLFLSKVTVEMSKYTKQYERFAQDITEQLLDVFEPEPEQHSTTLLSSIDWSTCPRHVGALVLRGNRCVLVRSLDDKNQQWKGMKIPHVLPRDGETPIEAALRCVEEYTGVEAATEVEALAEVPPVELFGCEMTRSNRTAPAPVRIQLYALYATAPPPDGPLEDADMEDEEESLYDWYTFANAVRRLQENGDERSIAALQTMACILVERANLGLIPCKWGGVFGQEMQVSIAGSSAAVESVNGTTTASNGIVAMGTAANETNAFLPRLKATTEEWTPSRSGDVLQDVRKANEMLMQRILERSGPAVTNEDKKKRPKLPVTLLSGFLGSGKTTLLSHILSNYHGIKVAILVNDMGEINIDAALIKSTTSIRQTQEHMVEMSNGCICCTLREDLLIEVAKIASSEDPFDYLLIESTGVSEPLPVAETFTFQDSTGLRLGDIAEIDTMVTVVDGSRFYAELTSLDSLKERDWQADPEDERTIAHLLCDQIDFANVIVLNKCDLISPEQKKDVRRLIQSMNPTARLVESTFSSVPLDSVLGTGLFSMSEAEKHEGWLKEERIGEHTPETEEYGISSFTFRALKPFHPYRLYEALESMVSQSNALYTDSIILRSKGFVWLADCPQLHGELSLAGKHYSVLPGNPWWAEIPKTEWPENLERDITPLWHEPFGDRQQEIVVIGQSLNQEAITKDLQVCLLSDAEMELGQEGWYKLCEDMGDPFDWQESLHAKMHEHAHEHAHVHE